MINIKDNTAEMRTKIKVVHIIRGSKNETIKIKMMRDKIIIEINFRDIKADKAPQNLHRYLIN